MCIKLFGRLLSFLLYPYNLVTTFHIFALPVKRYWTMFSYAKQVCLLIGFSIL